MGSTAISPTSAVTSSGRLDAATLREKIHGCWIGKCVGGTLGMAVEGVEGPLDFDFYRPVPTEMVPNDDLDLQVVWAVAMNEMADVRVNSHVLAAAFAKYCRFPWDEYAWAIRNLNCGIKPPMSGAYDNWFVDGMGCAIRSELWACLAAGDPALAAAYAREDASIDHVGDGLHAEVFLASLEASAFVETDIDRLIDIGLSFVPVDSKLHQAICNARKWWYLHHDWMKVRNLILEQYNHESWTDVKMNLAFIVLGLLAGRGDFGKAICTANNCGKDTDCTAATVGSIMGIIDPAGIPDRWTSPIGRQLILHPLVRGLDAPPTLDALVDLVVDLHARLNYRPPVTHQFQTVPPHMRVPAEVGFVDFSTDRSLVDHLWMPGPSSPIPQMPANATACMFEGCSASIAFDDFAGQAVLMKFRFFVPCDMKARVLFNSHEDIRVWVDGQYAFGREAGRMAPSAHRTPINQSADLFLVAGRHELLVAIRKPLVKRDVRWVMGVADSRTAIWLPHALTLGDSVEPAFREKKRLTRASRTVSL
jgi:ADP-ribosylglycohydrolase